MGKIKSIDKSTEINVSAKMNVSTEMKKCTIECFTKFFIRNRHDMLYIKETVIFYIDI